MATQTQTHCSNPFFSCQNTTPELKIKLEIQVKGEKYPICEKCWNTLAESDEYQWSQPDTQETKTATFEPNGTHIKHKAVKKAPKTNSYSIL